MPEERELIVTLKQIICSLQWKNIEGIVLTFKLHRRHPVIKEPCGSGKLVSLRKDWDLMAELSIEIMLLKLSNRTDDNHKTSRPSSGLVISKKITS